VTLAEDKPRRRRLDDDEAGRFTTADSIGEACGADDRQGACAAQPLVLVQTK
jgi:hypothetical protein